MPWQYFIHVIESIMKLQHNDMYIRSLQISVWSFRERTRFVCSGRRLQALAFIWDAAGFVVYKGKGDLHRILSSCHTERLLLINWKTTAKFWKTLLASKQWGHHSKVAINMCCLLNCQRTQVGNCLLCPSAVSSTHLVLACSFWLYYTILWAFRG